MDLSGETRTEVTKIQGFSAALRHKTLDGFMKAIADIRDTIVTLRDTL